MCVCCCFFKTPAPPVMHSMAPWMPLNAATQRIPGKIKRKDPWEEPWQFVRLAAPFFFRTTAETEVGGPGVGEESLNHGHRHRAFTGPIVPYKAAGGRVSREGEAGYNDEAMQQNLHTWGCREGRTLHWTAVFNLGARGWWVQTPTSPFRRP